MTLGTTPEPDRLPGVPHPRETQRLFGQEEAEAAYRAAVAAGRPPHAWLIAGPRGVGKATLAWAIARHLLAGDPAAPLWLPADHSVYRQTRALAHPGLLLVRRPWDDKGERLRTEITVDEVRGLGGFFRLSSAGGGARVAIIDAVDEMNASAVNALLKLLEEPPAGGSLLLINHSPARLLPTIRSRCRELRCRPLAPLDLAHAISQAGVETGASPEVLADLAAGSVGEALRLSGEDGLSLYEEVCGLLASAPPVDRPKLLALAGSVAGRAADARYEAVLRFLGLALARLARAAAGRPGTPAGQAEARAWQQLARVPGQARPWAEAAAAFESRSAHARAVRLDPPQVILDTVLEIEAAASAAAARAA